MHFMPAVEIGAESNLPRELPDTQDINDAGAQSVLCLVRHLGQRDASGGAEGGPSGMCRSNSIGNDRAYPLESWNLSSPQQKRPFQNHLNPLK